MKETFVSLACKRRQHNIARLTKFMNACVKLNPNDISMLGSSTEGRRNNYLFIAISCPVRCLQPTTHRTEYEDRSTWGENNFLLLCLFSTVSFNYIPMIQATPRYRIGSELLLIGSEMPSQFISAPRQSKIMP